MTALERGLPPALGSRTSVRRTREVPAAVRGTYTYDGDGIRRTAQEGNVAPTTMVWDGSDYLLLNEPTGNRVVLTLEGEIVACGTKDLLTDPLGSLVKEISAGATLGSLIELTPYGTLATGTPTIPYVFIAAYGYYTDTTDRDYVRARELMKKLGRWMQVDPLWLSEGNTSYEYADNSPLTAIDSSGLAPVLASVFMPPEALQGTCRPRRTVAQETVDFGYRHSPIGIVKNFYDCDKERHRLGESTNRFAPQDGYTDGRANALAHCMIACLINRLAPQCKWLIDLRDSVGKEAKMDRWNNTIGFRLSQCSGNSYDLPPF